MAGGTNARAVEQSHHKHSKCNNYGQNFFLNLTYKILKYLVAEYVEPYKEETLDEYQRAFRRRRSTTNQIFGMKTSVQKSYEYNVDIHHVYILSCMYVCIYIHTS